MSSPGRGHEGAANELKVPYSRNILTEARLGKGRAVKFLRDAIQSQPKLQQAFNAARSIEIENNKQKAKMMWVKDANSRVKRVETDFRDRATYTNPMNTRCVPDRKLVIKTKMQAKANANAGPNGTSLFN
jgi:hypothetical protein